ncbi:MAG: TIR domain-containing protein [Rhodospirillaceae bacterium]|nr:TIR domain-containing protein [Rhodospirillaceae bacterium]
MSAERFRYKAFISYSHRDAKIAQWLHRALESYRPPKHLIGRETATGPILKRIGTIFRDRDELPVAADLTGQINDALADTQFLIVLCSKTSATSKWVNQEVINFKRLKGAASIIAVIIDGEPFASTRPGQEAEECFAPALRYQVAPNGTLIDQPAEPIAADLRPGKDGKRMVKLKIIAGLLGVGLDELVQREALRRQRFMTAVTFASLLGIGVMGALTFNAIQARNDAEVAQERAERQKSQAEGLIEFMLGDLRRKLQPVGRLDVLDVVGERAITYFGSLTENEIDGDTAGRRARSLHLIGEIQDLRGDVAKANQTFTDAANATAKALLADPANPQRIFEDAQSQYWLGYSRFRERNYAEAEQYFSAYDRLAQQLLSSDPNQPRWLSEAADAKRNLGIIQLRQNKFTDAANAFELSRDTLKKILTADPKQTEALLNLAQTHAWLADTRKNQGDAVSARGEREQQITIYQSILDRDPLNRTALRNLVVAQKDIGGIALDMGTSNEAIEHLVRAAKSADKLVALDVDNVQWNEIRCRTYLELANAYDLIGKQDAAIGTLQTARDSINDLKSKNADIPMWLDILISRATILEARMVPESQRKSAINSLRRLTTHLTEKRAKLPNDADLRVLEQYVLLATGDLLNKLGNADEARSSWSLIVQSNVNQASATTESAVAAMAYDRIGDKRSGKSIANKLYEAGYRRPDFMKSWARLNQ